jgi:glycosyltransferase involved in cell wall biosynthesis
MMKADTVFTLSEFDKNYLLAMAPGLNVRVIPFPAGLDLTEKTFAQQKNSILFLASYKYLRRNADAALYFYREIFPLVRKVIPDARFIAAGYGPPADLVSLQDHDAAVTVPGFVEDLDECYKKAVVFVAPILVGGGIIVKILDAMAAGTPVVTTTYGNEGINAVPDRDLIVADDPERFAAGVARILGDRQFAEQLGRNGREFVRKRYSTEAAITEIEEAYQEIVSRKK